MEFLDGYKNRYGWCPCVTLTQGSVHDHRCRVDSLWQCTCHRCRYSCVPPSHGTCELVGESAYATPSQGTINDHRWRAPFLCITVHDYVLSMFTSWSCLDRYSLYMMIPYGYAYWHYVHKVDTPLCWLRFVAYYALTYLCACCTCFPHRVFIYSLSHHYVFTGYAAESVRESEAP